MEKSATQRSLDWLRGGTNAKKLIKIIILIDAKLSKLDNLMKQFCRADLNDSNCCRISTKSSNFFTS
jgi:hypothetical protein